MPRNLCEANSVKRRKAWMMCIVDCALDLQKNKNERAPSDRIFVLDGEVCPSHVARRQSKASYYGKNDPS